jgi:hypothetical protein
VFHQQPEKEDFLAVDGQKNGHEIMDRQVVSGSWFI